MAKSIKRKSSSSNKKKSSTAYRLSIRVKKAPRKSKSLKKSSRKPSKSKSVSKGKMTWFQAVAKARKELNIKGFVAIKKGTPLYKRAKELYGK